MTKKISHNVKKDMAAVSTKKQAVPIAYGTKKKDMSGRKARRSIGY